VSVTLRFDPLDRLTLRPVFRLVNSGVGGGGTAL